MLRVAILDDHPAVLAGLRRFIDPKPDLTVIAAAATAAELSHQLDGARADVLVLDYDLTRSDGFLHCQRIKRRSQPPAVVIYSAYGGHALVLAARGAGADGVVDKADPCRVFSPRFAGSPPVSSRCLPCRWRPTKPRSPTSTTTTYPSWRCCWTALRSTPSRTRFAATGRKPRGGRDGIVGRLRPGLRTRPDDRNVGSGHGSRSRLS
jgi:CheY-like chemotaxis protein